MVLPCLPAGSGLDPGRAIGDSVAGRGEGTRGLRGALAVPASPQVAAPDDVQEEHLGSERLRLEARAGGQWRL